MISGPKPTDAAARVECAVLAPKGSLTKAVLYGSHERRRPNE